jgi:hypothetical protein
MAAASYLPSGYEFPVPLPSARGWHFRAAITPADVIARTVCAGHLIALHGHVKWICLRLVPLSLLTPPVRPLQHSAIPP